MRQIWKVVQNLVLVSTMSFQLKTFSYCSSFSKQCIFETEQKQPARMKVPCYCFRYHPKIQQCANVLNLKSCSLQTDKRKSHKKMTTVTSHLQQPFRSHILKQIDYLNRISQLYTELSVSRTLRHETNQCYLIRILYRASVTNDLVTKDTGISGHEFLNKSFSFADKLFDQHALLRHQDQQVLQVKGLSNFI